MPYSKKQIKKLGSRLRNGAYSNSDLEMLDEWREHYSAVLSDRLASIIYVLKENDIPIVASSRSKRRKSIVRKLQRQAHSGMDLSRIRDLLGVRVLCRDTCAQNRIVNALRAGCHVEEVVDHRLSNAQYRAVHLVDNTGGFPVEVQVRTIMQQIWASESESFGEQVKEGGGPVSVRNYLEMLYKLIKKYELENREIDDVIGCAQSIGGYFEARKPLEGRFLNLQESFTRLLSIQGRETRFYIVVHDSQSNEIVNAFPFDLTENQEAVSDFHHKERCMNQYRYNVLMLAASSLSALEITHPNYFE